jgi:hypothetical protein
MTPRRGRQIHADAGQHRRRGNSFRIALNPEDCQRTPCPLSHVRDPAFTWTDGREVRQSEIAAERAKTA